MCLRGNIRRCFIVKHCYRKLRICSCVPFYRRGDETEFDNQVNDEMVETPEEFDEAGTSTLLDFFVEKGYGKIHLHCHVC